MISPPSKLVQNEQHRGILTVYYPQCRGVRNRLFPILLEEMCCRCLAQLSGSKLAKAPRKHSRFFGHCKLCCDFPLPSFLPHISPSFHSTGELPILLTSVALLRCTLCQFYLLTSFSPTSITITYSSSLTPPVHCLLTLLFEIPNFILTLFIQAVPGTILM